MVFQFFRLKDQFTCFDVNEKNYEIHKKNLLKRGFSFDGEPIKASNIEEALNKYKLITPDNKMKEYTKIGLIAGFFGI